MHPRAPQACLDDPFTELRVWTESPGNRGGSRPNVLWPYCTECTCWTDERHQVSKRHQRALAHWYPDMSLQARCSEWRAAPQQGPNGPPCPPPGLLPATQATNPNIPLQHQANMHTAPTDPGTNPPDHGASMSVPLFSPYVDKLQHDAFCRLFKLRPCGTVKDLSRSLNLQGIPFQDWWNQIAPTGSIMLWQIKLWAHGSPKELVKDAEADYIGKLLFQHMDLDGNYHPEPLQSPPLDV